MRRILTALVILHHLAIAISGQQLSCLGSTCILPLPCVETTDIAIPPSPAIQDLAISERWWAMSAPSQTVSFGSLDLTGSGLVNTGHVNENSTQFGYSIAVIANLLYVSDPFVNTGSVWRFNLGGCIGVQNCTVPAPVRIIAQSNTTDFEFGYSMAAHERLLIIGAPGANGQRGQCHCVDHTGTRTSARFPTPGLLLQDVFENARLGHSVSVGSSNNTIWVFFGLPGYDNGAGSVMIFSRRISPTGNHCMMLGPVPPPSGGAPSQLRNLDVPRLGTHVSTDGEFVAVSGTSTTVVIWRTLDITGLVRTPAWFAVLSSSSSALFGAALSAGSLLGPVGNAVSGEMLGYDVLRLCGDAFASVGALPGAPQNAVATNMIAVEPNNTMVLTAFSFANTSKLLRVVKRSCYELPCPVSHVPLAAIVAPVVIGTVLIAVLLIVRLVVWPQVVASRIVRDRLQSRVEFTSIPMTPSSDATSTFSSAFTGSMSEQETPAVAVVPTSEVAVPAAGRKALVWSMGSMGNDSDVTPQQSTSEPPTSGADSVTANAESEGATYSDGSASVLKTVNWADIAFAEVLGTGSYGEVWRADLWGTMVAVKILLNKGSDIDVDFKREVGILSDLRHPNIVLLIAACLQPPAMITEYIPNGSLLSIIETRSEELTCSHALSIAMGISRGLNYLHLRKPPILHRDLKSANILIDRGWEAKIADFGLSKIRDQSLANTVTGSPIWMAPEVLTGGGYSTPADVYSFGVVLWELFAQKLPYEGMSAVQVLAVKLGRIPYPGLHEQLPSTVPQEVVQLVKECVDSDPLLRPALSDVILRLQQVQD